MVAKSLGNKRQYNLFEGGETDSLSYVIPGEISHTSRQQSINKDAVLKVFLDYFMLSCSQKIYLVVENQMYQSGFSYWAALHGNMLFIIKRY
jgi:hypothetical protein